MQTSINYFYGSPGLTWTRDYFQIEGLKYECKTRFVDW